MKCLIDGDILVYEAASMAEYVDYVDDKGERLVRSFDYVEETLAQKIREIEEECWADEPSVLYLTNSEGLNGKINRQRKRLGIPEERFTPNFRVELATTKPYKGNRKGEKPFHYDNIISFMLSHYPTVVAMGMEADDMLCVHHLKSPLSTIICSRDKDLRMVEGLHYGWACGRQEQWGPKVVEPLGELTYENKKLKGTGKAFFYSQLITGDATDNIPGLPRGGAAMAYKLLSNRTSEDDMFRAVAERYEDKFGDEWEARLTEQARLLWMVRELNEDGSPVMWEMPSGR